MKIGIDFDNTIVNYEGVFYQVALSKGLIAKELEQSKDAIRDFLRKKGQENEWTELQGVVYGTKMDLARAYLDVDRFFYQFNPKVAIISHKTSFPYMGPKYDLHQSARNWLEKQPFFSERIPVFFELTLQEKLQRIKETKCSHFIDDLPEVLKESNFPANVQKILFDPDYRHPSDSAYTQLCSWKEILNYFQTYGE